MSGRNDLRYGVDGFLDMDQFDVTDPEQAMDAETEDALRESLLGADVPTASSEQFDAWIEDALAAGTEAPDTSWLVPDEEAALGETLGLHDVEQMPSDGADADPGWDEAHTLDDAGMDEPGSGDDATDTEDPGG
jgi:hypothetical protein